MTKSSTTSFTVLIRPIKPTACPQAKGPSSLLMGSSEKMKFMMSLFVTPSEISFSNSAVHWFASILTGAIPLARILVETSLPLKICSRHAQFYFPSFVLISSLRTFFIILPTGFLGMAEMISSLSGIL